MRGREEGEGREGMREGGGGRGREERNLNFYLKSESSCTPGVVAMATAKKRR